jgi:uncharacterized protein YabE (DUF348 family)
VRKIIPVVATGAAILVAAGGTVGYLTVDKAVTLSVDGQVSNVKTTAGSVRALLQSRGITITDHDVVAPNLDTKLSDGTRVAVQFGRQVIFTIDGRRQAIWTTATTVDQAAGALGVNISGAALSTSRSSTIGRQGLAVDVSTEKTVTILAAGKKRTVTTTGGTVAQALAAANITVDSDDKLSVSPQAPLVNGAHFRYTRVDVTSEKQKKPVAYATVRHQSGALTRGRTKVDTAGVAGFRTVTYRVVRQDGKVTSRTRTSSTLVRRPVTEVIVVGTKALKKMKKVSSSGGGSGVWDKIARCESGGNWSINTGNGFYGGLQFSLGTWRAYGGHGLPSHASRSTQIAVAKKIQASQGWGAWPACTRKLGLR